MNSCRLAPFLKFMTKPLTVALEQTTVRADLFTHQMQLCPAGRKNSSVPGEVIAFFFHQTSVLNGPKKWKKVRPEVVAPE